VRAVGLSYTPIELEWFYYLEGDRTKLNWFLLEVALEYYGRIMDSEELISYRERYDKEQIAQFCTSYVRRLKVALLKCIRGQTKHVNIYQEHIADFYPHHSHQMNTALCKAAEKALSHMLSACKNCPQHCLVDYQSRSIDFDIYKD
jgi:hypothetical protein